MNRDVVCFFALLALFVLAGLAARFHFASEPLWIDELHTAWTSGKQNSISEVISRAGQGNQTPMYFCITWLVQKCLGFSVLALRLPSITFSILTAVGAGLLVKKQTASNACGLLTTGLLALDYWMIFYGSEARPYAAIQLLAVVQLAAFFQEIKSSANEYSKGGLNWFLIVTTSCLLLTHLTSIVLIGTQIVIAAAMHRQLNFRRISNSFSMVIIPLVACFPIVNHVLSNSGSWNSVNRIQSLLLAIWPTLVCCAIPSAFAILVLRAREDIRAKITLAAGPPLLSLLIIIGLHCCNLVAIGSYRYVTFTTPLLAISSGLAFGTIANPLSQKFVAVTILMIALVLNPLVQNANQMSQLRLRHENWHAAIEKINDLNDDEGNPVFLFANLIEDSKLHGESNEQFINYLTFPLTSAYRLKNESTIRPMPTITKLRRWELEDLKLIVNKQRCFVVARTDQDLFLRILNELDQLAKSQDIHLSFERHEQSGNVVRVAHVNLIQKDQNE